MSVRFFFTTAPEDYDYGCTVTEADDDAIHAAVGDRKHLLGDPARPGYKPWRLVSIDSERIGGSFHEGQLMRYGSGLHAAWEADSQDTQTLGFPTLEALGLGVVVHRSAASWVGERAMSLNWTVENVEDFENRCYTEATVDQPMKGVKKGDTILSPTTEALIWISLSVGLGAITEKNWEKWYARAHTVEKLGGAFRWQLSDGEREELFLTPEDVYRHIGLSTNVHRETDAQWRRRVIAANVDSFARHARDWAAEESAA